MEPYSEVYYLHKTMLNTQNITAEPGTTSINGPLLTTETSFTNNQELVSKHYVDNHSIVWGEFTTEVDSTEIVKNTNSIEMIDIDNTTVLLNELGTYRCTFTSQYNLTSGMCVCLTELNNLNTSLLNETFTTHAASFGSETLTPGRYATAAASSHAGVLTLDALGVSDAEFIFHCNGAHTTGAMASVVLTGGAKSCNVFWVVNGAIGFGADCNLIGTYTSTAAIIAGAVLRLDGRLLTSLGAITLPGVLTATAPVDSSTRITGVFANTLLYSGGGAISTTSYVAINAINWLITTELGSVSGFGSTYDNIYPVTGNPLITVQIKIYSGDVLFSTILVEQDAISNYLNMFMSSTVVINTDAKKTIKVKARIVSNTGGVVFSNRSLFLYRLDPSI
jgi:hypothetical protein